MDNLVQNLASSLWIVIGIQVLVWLKHFNKKFGELYDELKEETQKVFAAKTDYCPHCGAKMDGGADNG